MPGGQTELVFWGAYPTALRITNFVLHMSKMAAMLYAWHLTGSGKLAPSTSITSMDTAVTCGNLVPGPFGDTMVLEAIGLAVYVVLQFWQIFFGREVTLAEKIVRLAVGIQAAAHCRAHFIPGTYAVSWDIEDATIQKSRDESSFLLNVMSFIFLGMVLFLIYFAMKNSPVKNDARALTWVVAPTMYTGCFFTFYFTMLSQKEQYIFMNELVNGIVVPWMEAYNGWGFKPAAVAQNEGWQRRSRYFYYAHMALAVTQWVEHRWCEEFLRFEPHFWFDLATCATFEAGIAAAMYEAKVLKEDAEGKKTT